MGDGAKDTNNHVFGAQATNLNLLTITAEICIWREYKWTSAMCHKLCPGL